MRNLPGGPPKSVDGYLAAVPAEAGAALARLRRDILAAAPGCTEGISYQMPAFKHTGRWLVSFGAAKNHCAFYVLSPAVMKRHAALLKGYDTSTGTIRFPAAKPLPAALVNRLVKARIKEIEGA
ncbi:MAG TPA: DUF1801 domain-containing protein [Candidatus Thermoplasmatota archaeon]|nr:DUF1801 domain-containing protein [Candidatus Thermoplasmatota archaeon]